MVSCCTILAVVATLAAAPDTAQPETAGLTPIEITCLDDHATGYATFQSHNQKVLSSRGGIFTTHIRSRNKPYTAQQWRLSRSVDGGTRFATIYEATHATNLAVTETDKAGNVYLARPDFIDHHAYLYRFFTKDGYAKPVVTKIPNAAAGKFAMMIDPARRQLYFFAHNNTFNVIGLDGKIRRSMTLLRAGKHAVLQYPLLSLATDGALHAAWTTQKHGVYLYWDIHHMISRDAGASWTTLDGRPVALPVVADDGGSATRITLDDEFDVHTWLSSLMAKDGKVHFLYMAQTKPQPREHYVRYDVATGRQDVRIRPKFKGDQIKLLGLAGFFAAQPSLKDGPLYCVSNNAGRIACLASDDNGQTWYDYAVTDKTYKPYSIGGCRELTDDGYVIGTFTDQVASTADLSSKCKVYFFKIRAGLSRASVATVKTEDDGVVLTFGDVRGQPSSIRFHDRDGKWGRWQPFRREIRLSQRLTSFQLRSRLNVVSAPQPIAGGDR